MRRVLKPVDPTKIEMRDLIRFFALVNFQGEDECWPWGGAGAVRGTGSGYGRFHFGPGTVSVAAHRFSLAAATGVSVVGVARHSCDNPPCVNPKHIIDGTFKENSLDMVARRRGNWITRPETVQRGEMNGNAKLTAEDVGKIRQRHSRGERQVDLASAFGVTQAEISQIIRRVVWREVH